MLLRNESQLNCVALRSQLKDEVTWGAVKGQDERPLFGGALDSSHVTTGGLCRWKAINKEGRHVGLDFYDLLIEADYTSLRRLFAGESAPFVEAPTGDVGLATPLKAAKRSKRILLVHLTKFLSPPLKAGFLRP